jgi:hypothetical protein
MFSAKKKAAQSEFWIPADQMVSSAKSGFYAKLEETLESFGFAAKVRALCAPAYDTSGVGRPGIDPVVYLKMVMVGFFGSVGQSVGENGGKEGLSASTAERRELRLASRRSARLAR